MKEKKDVKYTENIHIKVTEEEKLAFKELANQAGVTMSDLIRLTMVQYIRKGFNLVLEVKPYEPHEHEQLSFDDIEKK